MVTLAGVEPATCGLGNGGSQNFIRGSKPWYHLLVSQFPFFGPQELPVLLTNIWLPLLNQADLIGRPCFVLT